MHLSNGPFCSFNVNNNNNNNNNKKSIYNLFRLKKETILKHNFNNNNNNNNNNFLKKIFNENSLLTYFKQIAIHKLKVEKRTIKKLFTIYFDEEETTFKPFLFSDKVTMLFFLKKSITYTKLKILKKRE